MINRKINLTKHGITGQKNFYNISYDELYQHETNPSL